MLESESAARLTDGVFPAVLESTAGNFFPESELVESINMMNCALKQRAEASSAATDSKKIS